MISYPVALAIFSAIALLTGETFGRPAKYDQRQEGDLNVRTDVEDVVFVLVPPKDLISAGMGIVAATAANFLKKNHGPLGPERWPLKTASKLGFVPVEKSPYKIDLEKSAVQTKKISHYGDPNRYNFQEKKNSVVEHANTKLGSTEAPVVSSAEVPHQETKTKSTTEMKTTPHDLTKEKEKEKKKEVTEAPVEKITEKTSEKPEETTKEKTIQETTKNKENSETETRESPVVIGEFSEGGLGPTSIFSHEGCGPDAYRDHRGICIYKKSD